MKDIKLKFIYEFEKEYEKEIQNCFKYKFIKICGTVINCTHRKSRVFMLCIFCKKKVDNNICDSCGKNPYTKI